jgi:hypothetical protein
LSQITLHSVVFVLFSNQRLPYVCIVQTDTAMNTLHLDQNILAFYIKATSFPDGIFPAHQKLHALIPFSHERKYFGISQGGKDGQITYLAAAAELEPGDLKKYFIIRKGNYAYIDVADYRKNVQVLGETFNQLLKHPQLDHQKGYCLEWYLDENTCRCLVKLND